MSSMTEARPTTSTLHPVRVLVSTWSASKATTSPRRAAANFRPRLGLDHDVRSDGVRIRNPRGDPDRRAPRRALRRHPQQVIGRDVQCRREGVQIGVHEGPGSTFGCETPILDALRVLDGHDTPDPTPWNRSSSSTPPPSSARRDIPQAEPGRRRSPSPLRLRSNDPWP